MFSKIKYSSATRALVRALGAQVRTDEAARFAASLDNLRLSFMPAAVVFPRDDAAIGTMLRLANKYKVPVTPRGTGTSTTGSACPVQHGWVLDLSRWKKVRIDSLAGLAHVEAGVVTAEIDAAAAKHGLFYPPDPSSLHYCTIGGNLALNAGGLRGAKYGVTRDYVMALEGFLPTGEFVRWGAPLRKFASGYNLRDLWVGSGGMLGVITRATLRLVARPAARHTFLAAFANEDAAARTVLAMMRARLTPSILEFMDRQTVECTERKWGRPVFAEAPRATVLLIEVDGSAADVATQRAAVGERLRAGGALAIRDTDDAGEAEELWRVRRTCSQAMFQMGDAKLNEDVVVPPRQYRALLRYTRQLKRTTGLATPTFGHAMDGNFHVHLMYHRADHDECRQAERGVAALMKKVVALGGAVTGEHGIGLAKSPFLRWQHSPAEVKAMRAIKRALDPRGILNPGQIFTPVSVWKQTPVKVRLAWDKD
ncbi:MAG: FAD-linked oxidase C-terminal domain-containing protein [Opitutales bacterium]|jgi:glycolate oxidase